MPSGHETLSAYFQSGNPDNLAVSLAAAGTPGDFGNYAPGQLGRGNFIGDRVYVPVILDSGAVAANPVGAVLANQVAFWKNKENRIVTNDHRQAIMPTAQHASVAGVFRRAVATPGAGGTLVAIVAKGVNIPVVAGTITNVGDAVMADSTVSVSRVISATGILTQLGHARTTANPANIDLDVPLLP